MVIDSVKEITHYRAFFHRDEHPEIFDAPLYKRKSMCLELLDAEFNLVDPLIISESFGKDKIELVVYSY